MSVQARAHRFLAQILLFGRKNGKLVAVQASDDIRITEGRAQHGGAANQKLVTTGMTVDVVYMLQPVYIREKDNCRLRIAAAEFQLVQRQHQETTPIVEPGQLVG